jgi:hypothetical protein
MDKLQKEYESYNVGQLRGEARRLKRQVDCMPISQMQRCVLINYIYVYREVLETLRKEPMLIVGERGKRKARIIPTTSQKIEDECDIRVPLTPLEKTAPIPPKDFNSST